MLCGRLSQRSWYMNSRDEEGGLTLTPFTDAMRFVDAKSSQLVLTIASHKLFLKGRCSNSFRRNVEQASLRMTGREIAHDLVKSAGRRSEGIEVPSCSRLEEC